MRRWRSEWVSAEVVVRGVGGDGEMVKIGGDVWGFEEVGTREGRRKKKEEKKKRKRKIKEKKKKIKNKKVQGKFRYYWKI